MTPLLVGLLACTDPPSVVVVGGGLAGLAAAAEAGQGGAAVTLLEAAPEVGGAARWAAGITWIPTAEEAEEWAAAAGEASAARDRYIARVVPDVVEGLRLTFSPVPDPSGEGARLVAPAGGGPAVVGALAARAAAAGVHVRTGCRVDGLSRDADGWRVETRTCGEVEADRVVIATGGFAGDIEESRQRLDLGGGILLRSAPRHADGGGIVLATAAGAAAARNPLAVIYAHAVPDPRDAKAALMVTQLPRDAVVVDTDGGRQDSLLAVRGEAGRALLDLPGQRAWLVGTAEGLGQQRAMPLDGPPVALSAVARAHGFMAPDLSTLSAELAMRGDALSRYAFEPGAVPAPAAPLPPRGPYIAVPLHPTPAKSLGGVDADLDGRALDAAGAPVPGLFVAGELMGFGEPYGAAPRDSTMVAGAVLSGQAAGRAAGER